MRFGLLAQFIVLALLFVAVPARADTHLLGPVSEDTPMNPLVCPAGHAIKGITCFGWFCDNKHVLCDDAPEHFTRLVERPERVSEEAAHEELTTAGFLAGLGCEGWYCDFMYFTELRSELRARDRHCTWTEWFSEENTGAGENARICDDGYLVAGIRCHGDYCDSLKLQCCAK